MIFIMRTYERHRVYRCAVALWDYWMILNLYKNATVVLVSTKWEANQITKEIENQKKIFFFSMFISFPYQISLLESRRVHGNIEEKPDQRKLNG